jgi:hypothetical protein
LIAPSSCRTAGGLDRVAGARAVDEDAFLAVRSARLGEGGVDSSSLVTLTLQNTPPSSAAMALPFSSLKVENRNFHALWRPARARLPRQGPMRRR